MGSYIRYMPPWADIGGRLEKIDSNFDVYMLGKLLWCMGRVVYMTQQTASSPTGPVSRCPLRALPQLRYAAKLVRWPWTPALKYSSTTALFRSFSD